MGTANKTHWIGVFLLFASSILLLITTISAPVWDHVSLLHITTPYNVGLSHTAVNFGTFGYCILNMDPEKTGSYQYCTGRHTGYSPTTVISEIDHASISTIAAGTSDSLTRVMVLHPIACGLAFVAFLASIGRGIFGSLVGAMVAFLAWILVLVSLAVDFSLFGILHHHVNHDGSGSRAQFGSAIWCLVAAFVGLFFGMMIVFFTCCANYRGEKKKKNREGKTERVVDGPAPSRKKTFGMF